MTIERLDRSKPPPGYTKTLHRSGWSLTHGGKELGFYQARSAIADLTKDAWAHHEAQHDPPGMCLEEVPGPDGAWRWRCGEITNTGDGPMTQVRARAAAWRWYWRQVEDARITLDEWANAGAPLDLAPTPAYVRNGGVWRMENHPLVQAELERIGVDVDLRVCASTAMWCESIAKSKP